MNHKINRYKNVIVKLTLFYNLVIHKSYFYGCVQPDLCQNNRKV